MSAGRILYFISEINKIQDILNRSVIPNNIGYIVSRFFIFIVIGITTFDILKNEGKNIGNLFFGIMFGWSISALILLPVALLIGKGEPNNFAPIEIVTYFIDKQEKKDAMEKEKKLREEINAELAGKTVSFSEIQVAESYLKKEYPKVLAEHKRAEKVFSELEKFVKKEIFETLPGKKFPVSISDKDIEVIMFLTIKKTTTYKEKSKYMDKSSDKTLKYEKKNLAETLRNNPLIDSYMEEIALKADKFINERMEK